MLVDLIKGSANRLSFFSYAFSIHTIYSLTAKKSYKPYKNISHIFGGFRTAILQFSQQSHALRNACSLTMRAKTQQSHALGL